MNPRRHRGGVREILPGLKAAQDDSALMDAELSHCWISLELTTDD
jgi:hypothetical protein